MEEKESKETIADIVAEMKCGNFDAVKAVRFGYYHEIKILMKKLADRIEAAWKREYDILNSEREKCRLYGLNEHEKVLKLKAQLLLVGNAAAMREAVEAVVRALSESNDVQSALLLMQAEAKCKAALSAPPRNCDRYNDVEDSWQDYKQFRSQKGEDIYFDMVHFWPFSKWLFAPSAERKGGGDGE